MFTKPAEGSPQAIITEKLLQLDPLGIVLAVASVVCYFLALEWGGLSKPWNDVDVIGTLVGSLLLAFTFALVRWFLEERASIVPRVLAQRSCFIVICPSSIN